MYPFSLRSMFVLSLSVVMATTAFAGKKSSTPERKKSKSSATANLRPEATSPQGGATTGQLDYDSPRGGQYEDQGGSGAFIEDGAGGAFGIFKDAATVNLTAYSRLRDFANSLSPVDQAQLRSLVTASAVGASLALAARAALRAGAMARGVTLAGALVATTASAEDVIFNDQAFKEDPSLFLFAQDLSAAELVNWAQSYGLISELNGVIAVSANAICSEGAAVGAESFCSAVQ